jgi:hypothetical protein
MFLFSKIHITLKPAETGARNVDGSFELTTNIHENLCQTEPSIFSTLPCWRSIVTNAVLNQNESFLIVTFVFD